MKAIKSGLWMLFLSLGVLVVINGCGVSQKDLDDAIARIESLRAKGVPDSLLADAKVLHMKASGAKKAGRANIAKKHCDSMMYYIGKAEAKYQSDMQKLKPFIDSMMASINKRKANISGLHLRMADSVITIIDSFVAKDWLLQAKDIVILMDTLMTSLEKDEKTAADLRPKILGTWSGTRTPGGGYKAVESRSYTLKSDGTFNSRESMKGQTDAYTKEDWTFLDQGKWDLMGDTLWLFVEKEKCPRQVYHSYKKKDGKLQWVKFEAPTYDSTITDHKKDKYMTYEYMKENFKKK